MSRRFRVLTLVVVVAALGACSGPAPSDIATLPADVACDHIGALPPTFGKGAPTATPPKLVGWVDGRVLVVFADGACLYAPQRDRWSRLQVPGPVPGGLRPIWADGRSWAGASADSLAVVLGTEAHVIPKPAGRAWTPEWGFADGQLLRPVPGAGYIVPLVRTAVRFSENGVLAEQPIPADRIVVTAADATDTLLLRGALDLSGAGPLMKPFQLFVWGRPTDPITAVANGVTVVNDAANGLAWVGDASGAVHLLATDGTLGPSIWSWDPRTVRPSLSPSGNTVAVQPLDGSSVQLISMSTGASQRFDIPCGPISWNGDDLACLASPTQPSDKPWVLLVVGPGAGTHQIAIR